MGWRKTEDKVNNHVIFCDSIELKVKRKNHFKNKTSQKGHPPPPPNNNNNSFIGCISEVYEKLTKTQIILNFTPSV